MQKRNLFYVLGALFLAFALSTSVSLNSIGLNEAHAAGAKYTIRLAHNETTEDPIHKGMVLFKDLVALKSKGDVDVQVFPAGELGSGQTNAEQLAAGSLEMALIFYTYLTGYVPWVALADYPFSMPELESTWRKYDSKIIPATSSVISSKGILMIGHVSAAYKMWLSQEPIRKPEDIAGKKYRCAATGIAPVSVKAWGGKPVVVPWSEAFTGLEQGIFDMMDLPVPAGVTFHFYDIVKYVTKSDFVYASFAVCVSKKWFESLPANIQKIIKESLRPAMDHANAGRARLAAEAFDIFAKKGVKVITLSAKDKEAFKTTLIPVKEYAVKEYGQDKVNMFLAK
jgi:C4-dicarboxylate-binding protein DctP